MKFENTQVWGFEHAIRGMRNPKNSWNKSDSRDCMEMYDEATCGFCDDPQYGYIFCDGVGKCGNTYAIGPNDMTLMKNLIKGGSEHRKFMRQIFVSVDITAPLYWWKEFDTYKVGTVANSTSTMHKLTSAPITLDCFEIDDFNNVPYPIEAQRAEAKSNCDHDFIQMCLIPYLEYLRQKYLETGDKVYWKELIRWLPESWLQTRTITLNYENIYAIVHQRFNHKLNEWSGKDDSNLTNFIAWARELPYADKLIFADIDKTEAEYIGEALKEISRRLATLKMSDLCLSDFRINIMNDDGVTFKSFNNIMSEIADKIDKHEIF